jgi:hypothetical protein
MAFGGSSFESGNQGPQLVHGFDSPTSLTGDFSEPDCRVGELGHGG